MDERDKRDGTAKGGPKACGGIGYEVGIAAILAKSRSFPLISVHLSRALGWDMGVNGGGLGLFGGDIGGFGGRLRGFEGALLAVFGRGHWTAHGLGGGRIWCIG